MKRILIVCFAVLPIAANGAAPSTSCPAGYVEATETAMIVSSGACPSGYVSVGTADSCMVSSPAGSCMMYVPTGMIFTDDNGSYEFTEICPLTVI